MAEVIDMFYAGKALDIIQSWTILLTAFLRIKQNVSTVNVLVA